jgi:hypothetical protein
MEKNQSEGLALEKILEIPKLAYVFTDEHIPSIFTTLHKKCILCLTNKRLAIAKAPLLGFSPMGYTIEKLKKDLEHPESVSIPLTDIIRTETGGFLRPFLKVWYQTESGPRAYSFVPTLMIKGFKKWEKTIKSIKSEQEET